MTEIPLPHTVHGWFDYMAREGMSDRPFPEDGTDLIDSDYADPMDIKPERTALMAILAVRAYQRAKKSMNSQRGLLSSPSIAEIMETPMPLEEMAMRLITKNREIGYAFIDHMKVGLLEDEAYLQSQPTTPSAVRAAGAYHRLESILSPYKDPLVELFRKGNLAQEVDNPTPNFVAVFGGVKVLPQNMNTLLHYILLADMQVSAGEIPVVTTLVRQMEGSYDKFIVPLASVHRADVRKLLALQSAQVKTARLSDDSLELLPEIMQMIKGEERVDRPRTARCAFLASTDDMQMFLDEPVDYKDPLRDAFDLYMSFLAA